MSEQIVSGAGDGQFPLRITSKNRAFTDGVTESLSSQQSRDGLLFGVGTGFLTTTWTDDLYPVLWLRNDDPDNLFHIQKIIHGWNGGTSSKDTAIKTFIKYQTTEPSGANTSTPPQIENISKSGTTSAVTDSKATSYKWDGSGSTGLTGSTGGFLQIPNMIAQGNDSVQIDGEIILGQNDSMEIQIQPSEAGIYNVAIVYYKAPIGGRI